MKRFWLLITVILLGSCCPGLCATMTNGDFEKGTLTSWRSNQQSYGKVKLFKVIKSNTKVNGKFSLQSCGDKKNGSNHFITLVKDIRISPSSGKTYRFGGWVKAALKGSPGKVIKMSIREIDASGSSIGYQNIQIDPKKSHYAFYEKEFSPSKRTKSFQFYLILSGLSDKDFIYWDNLFFSEKKVLGKPFDSQKKKQKVSRWKLKDKNVLAFIDSQSGLLDSLRFGNEIIHPAAVNNSIIYVQMNNKEFSFKRSLCKPVKQNEKYIKLELIPVDKKVPFKGYVEYKINNGFFSEKVVLIALDKITKSVKLGIRHGFNVDSWDKLICAMRPLRVIEAKESTFFSYREKDNDRNITFLDQYQQPVYPLTLLENSRGTLLAGAFNLDKFVTISPNIPVGYFPSLQQNPLSINKGQKFEFSYNCRFFSASKYQLRDVWREYAKNIYSDNPLIKSFFPYKDRPYRTFFRGTHVGSTCFKKWREKRIFPNSNIWWYGWQDLLTETYPVKGEWYTESYGHKKVSAEKMKSEISRLQKNGNRILLYFRQLANLNLKGKKFPHDWYRVKAGGSLDLYGGGYNFKLPKSIAKDVGYKTIPWGTFNFDNLSFNDFYIKQVKAAMKYYNPEAIGWDFGWRPSHVGMFAVQAKIYDWLRKKYPNKKVVTNECGGGPGLFYTDLALLENGVLGGKSEYDFEICKAFGNSLVCLERRNLFNKAVLINLNGGHTWMNSKGLKINKQYIDYLLSKKPELRNTTEALGRLCQLRSSLRDQALGVIPGYMEGAKPIPSKLLQMAIDTINMPLIIESFVVKFPNNKDRMNPLFASAWLTENKARLIVYNDSNKTCDFSLKLQKKYFSKRGWMKSQLAEGKAFEVSPEGVAVKQINWSSTSEDIVLSGSLAPFSAYMLLKDKK
jgi:Carbohydrate binding domain